MDTKRLCDLTSAADSLQLRPLVDLTSRTLARIIEGKSPEEIREIFHLPDDLTEVCGACENSADYSFHVQFSFFTHTFDPGREVRASEKYNWWPEDKALEPVVCEKKERAKRTWEVKGTAMFPLYLILRYSPLSIVVFISKCWEILLASIFIMF